MQISRQLPENDPEYARLMAGVVAAARAFRDAMQHYLAEQARLVEQGLDVAALVERNFAVFEMTVRAEETLFAALDALDRYEWPRRTH
jgi:hypothetical protein